MLIRILSESFLQPQHYADLATRARTLNTYERKRQRPNAFEDQVQTLHKDTGYSLIHGEIQIRQLDRSRCLKPPSDIYF